MATSDDWMLGRCLIIDPPSGWKYGFPKPYLLSATPINEWLAANGYPQEEIDTFDGKDVPCRYWEDRRP